MKQAPTFSIPLQPHVKQLLLSEFGPEPLRIHQNTYMGRLVLLVVEKLPYRQLRRDPPPEGASYQISLPSALKHYRITPENAKKMGEALEKAFNREMIMFVKGQVAVTQNERAALRSFFNLYGINPSDYDLEAARKAYRDYKDQILRHNTEMYDLLQSPELLFDDRAAAKLAS